MNSNKLDFTSYSNYEATKAYADDIINALLIDDTDSKAGTVAILPKCVSYMFPNPDDWFITENNLESLVRDGSALLWMAERLTSVE